MAGPLHPTSSNSSMIKYTSSFKTTLEIDSSGGNFDRNTKTKARVTENSLVFFGSIPSTLSWYEARCSELSSTLPSCKARGPNYKINFVMLQHVRDINDSLCTSGDPRYFDDKELPKHPHHLTRVHPTTPMI